MQNLGISAELISPAELARCKFFLAPIDHLSINRSRALIFPTFLRLSLQYWAQMKTLNFQLVRQVLESDLCSFEEWLFFSSSRSWVRSSFPTLYYHKKSAQMKATPLNSAQEDLLEKPRFHQLLKISLLKNHSLPNTAADNQAQWYYLQADEALQKFYFGKSWQNSCLD